jgi:SAM-dependent methyltransferase
MGSAAEQSRFWGAVPHDWAENERLTAPAYEAVFDAVGVGPAVRLLDVGCGAGWAIGLAIRRGATVSGLDAAEGLLALARERSPRADLRHGDLAELPYGDAAFDVVTSFNALQYAADPVAALRQARRVTAPAGSVVVMTWGAPEQCESRTTMAALRALTPAPTTTGGGGPFALSTPGRLEELCEAAGLTPAAAAEVVTPFEFADLRTAIRLNLSSGPARRTIAHAGLAATRTALTTALAASRQEDGSYRQVNVFRYLVATA